MSDEENKPSIYRLHFGKNRGRLISETGREYLEWLYAQDVKPQLLPEESRKLIAKRIGVEYQPIPPAPKKFKSADEALTYAILGPIKFNAPMEPQQTTELL